jgi:hypothetical protein
MGVIYLDHPGLSESSLGTFADAISTTRVIGTAGSILVAGFFFTPSASGEIRRAIWEIGSGADAANFHCELWSVSGNNPLSQIGSDSDAVAAVNGDNTYTWADPRPAITGGTEYCCVIVSDGGDGNFNTVANNASYGSDRDATTITSLNKTSGIDGANEDWRVEIVVATQ